MLCTVAFFKAHTSVVYFDVLFNGAYTPKVCFEVGLKEMFGEDVNRMSYSTYSFRFDGFEFNEILSHQEMRVFVPACAHIENMAEKIQWALGKETHKVLESQESLERFLRTIPE